MTYDSDYRSETSSTLSKKRKISEEQPVASPLIKKPKVAPHVAVKNRIPEVVANKNVKVQFPKRLFPGTSNIKTFTNLPLTHPDDDMSDSSDDEIEKDIKV